LGFAQTHQGPCPWTPPPFEKGGRKLHFGLGNAQPTRGFAPGPLFYRYIWDYISFSPIIIVGFSAGKKLQCKPWKGADKMQALMLAAGMGRRLGKHTEKCTKCMVRVGGRTLLERAVEALKLAGVTKLIMVVGWECEKLIQYIDEHIAGMEFKFIRNCEYAETNNIYSLYLAREYLLQDDTLLMESDLIFDKCLLREIVNYPEEDLAAVARYEPWMDGTVATISEDGTIQSFIEKKDFLFQSADSYYKTANIYKFSRKFSQKLYVPFLIAYITAYGKNQYYETVLKTLAHLPHARLKAFILNNISWYEIDNARDLDIANTLFAPENEKLAAYECHYGGYWNFPGIHDFCYLVNPYFPPDKMKEQMIYSYNTLLTQYPSGINVQRLLISKMLQLSEEYILAGNGAAELICTLGKLIHGRLTVSLPAFNEYIRCFKGCEISTLFTLEDNFQLDCERLIQAAENTDYLVIINPDNPSGSFLTFEDLAKVLDVCERKKARCIIDESFIDFADCEKRYTLLRDSYLERWKNLVVIKSISKSYGVPGLRLGILATADTSLIGRLKESLPVWNINSFAEYFLQLCPIYYKEYTSACNELAKRREGLMEQLDDIYYLTAYPSQANFIMLEVHKPYDSKTIAERLLSEHKLLVKDLSQKPGFNGRQFIRVAVKSERENHLLYNALKVLA